MPIAEGSEVSRPLSVVSAIRHRLITNRQLAIGNRQLSMVPSSEDARRSLETMRGKTSQRHSRRRVDCALYKYCGRGR